MTDFKINMSCNLESVKIMKKKNEIISTKTNSNKPHLLSSYSSLLRNSIQKMSTTEIFPFELDQKEKILKTPPNYCLQNKHKTLNKEILTKQDIDSKSTSKQSDCENSIGLIDVDSLTDSTDVYSGDELTIPPLREMKGTITDPKLTHRPLSIEISLYGEIVDPSYGKIFTISKTDNYFVTPCKIFDYTCKFEQSMQNCKVSSIEIQPLNINNPPDYYDYNKTNSFIKNNQKFVECTTIK